MKIVHVCHVYHPSEGGVQTWFKNVSERLVRDYGDDVTVVTTNSVYGPERRNFKRIDPANEVINGVKVIRFAYRRWHILPYHILYKTFAVFGLRLPGSMLAKAAGPYSPAMKRFLVHVNADAICASSSNYYYMQLPLWRKCNFFYFGSIHLSEDKTVPILNELQKKSIMASNLYLANTAYEKRRLTEAGIDANKIKVIGVGVVPVLFSASANEISSIKSTLNIPAGSLVIGYAGRVEQSKNVRLLVDAFAQLASKYEHIYLLLAGAGSDYARSLQQETALLPAEIASRIKWQLNFDANAKAALFHSMDMLVLPSNNESFGIVFLEAWICKKPVIGSAIGAVKDVIDDNIDGLLFRKNDRQHLSEQLEVLINDANERTRLAGNGYKKVIENYTWNIITKKLRQCYVDAAGNN